MRTVPPPACLPRLGDRESKCDMPPKSMDSPLSGARRRELIPAFPGVHHHAPSSFGRLKWYSFTTWMETRGGDGITNSVTIISFLFFFVLFCFERVSHPPLSRSRFAQFEWWWRWSGNEGWTLFNALGSLSWTSCIHGIHPPTRPACVCQLLTGGMVLRHLDWWSRLLLLVLLLCAACFFLFIVERSKLITTRRSRPTNSHFILHHRHRWRHDTLLTAGQRGSYPFSQGRVPDGCLPFRVSHSHSQSASFFLSTFVFFLCEHVYHWPLPACCCITGQNWFQLVDVWNFFCCWYIWNMFTNVTQSFFSLSVLELRCIEKQKY